MLFGPAVYLGTCYIHVATARLRAVYCTLRPDTLGESSLKRRANPTTTVSGRRQKAVSPVGTGHSIRRSVVDHAARAPRPCYCRIIIVVHTVAPRAPSPPPDDVGLRSTRVPFASSPNRVSVREIRRPPRVVRSRKDRTGTTLFTTGVESCFSGPYHGRTRARTRAQAHTHTHTPTHARGKSW